MGSSKASCPSSRAPGNPVNVSTLCAALKHRMWTKLHNGMSGAGRDPLKQETDLSIICSIGGKTIIQSGMVCVAGRVGSAAGWAKFSPPRNPQLTAAGLCWPGVCNAVLLPHVRSSGYNLRRPPTVKCHLCIVVTLPTQSTHRMQPGLTYSVICSNCESSFEESWVDMCWAGGTHVSAGQGKVRPSR